MREPVTVPDKLKESIVKQALKTLDWAPLEKHLHTLDLRGDIATDLIGHLCRSGDLLLKRSDPKRAAARKKFIEALAEHLANHAGSDAVIALREVIAMFGEIEAGYAELLRTLAATVAAKLLPEVQASAALYRAAHACHDLTTELHTAAKKRIRLTLQSFRVDRDDGSTYSPDGVVAALNDITTMTLLLLGHQQKWFDTDNYLLLPDLTTPTEDEIYKAGLTEVLAESWRQWERMEQRCRFFGGRLKISREHPLPEWTPAGTETLVEYDHISEAECLDYLANQRLNDRLIQTFQEMLLQTNIQATAAGIDKPLALPPGAFVSALEAHAGVSLSEILGYAIVDDRETPCGLRLVEWIRGYAVLQFLAEKQYNECGKDGLYFTLARAELITILERVGLKHGSADRFINLASLQASSRDLFDQPLIRMQNGDLLLFGPGTLSADPARVTLSAIGNKGEQLSRKGKAFEHEMLSFFQDHGFDAKAIKFKQQGEEFEYDVIVPWDDHVFVFECKNRTLSGHNPVAAYYFALEIASAARQVRRLAGGLVRHANVFLARTGIDVIGKVIVPCVLNSLPYAMKGDDEGVFVTDASSLKRFFQDRNFHLVRPHHLAKNTTVLHRTAMKSIWSGDRPTAVDLVGYLTEPLQLQLVTAHTERTRHGFGLGERTIVAVDDLAHTEMTPASVSSLFSIDAKWVDREDKRVARAVAKERRKRERRAIIEADRAWRKTLRRQSKEKN